jgi:CspA family cold shock protein
MPRGTVKWFDPVKGYGFITPEAGSKDAFVHISSVERAGLTALSEGQKIEFEMVADKRGRMAADNLRVID